MGAECRGPGHKERMMQRPGPVIWLGARMRRGALVLAAALCLSPAAGAQETAPPATITIAPRPPTAPVSSPRPQPRPDGVAPEIEPAPEATAPEAAPAAATSATEPAKPVRDPNRGAVTNLPIPRYVSLKGNVGNARRGPGLTHRIDWVFTHGGMPLRITAEHENWRRVEDAEGMGGWVHYALLSGVRTVLVTAPLADFRRSPDPGADILFQAETGVIGRISECAPDWCRVSVEGEKGWVSKAQIWGSDPGEIVE